MQAECVCFQAETRLLCIIRTSGFQMSIIYYAATISELQIVKSVASAELVYYPECLRSAWEKQRKISDRTTGLRAAIWIQSLQIRYPIATFGPMASTMQTVLLTTLGTFKYLLHNMMEMNRKNSFREVTSDWDAGWSRSCSVLFQAISGVFVFTAESRFQLGIIQSLIQWIKATLYFELRRPEPDANHLPHIWYRGKEQMALCLHSLMHLQGLLKHGSNLTFMHIRCKKNVIMPYIYMCLCLNIIKKLETRVTKLYRWYNWGIWLFGDSFKQC